MARVTGLDGIKKKSVGEDLQLKNNSRAVTWRMAKVLASITRNFQSACYFVDNE